MGALRMKDQSTAIDATLLEGIGLVVQRWAYVEALEGEFLTFLTGAKPGGLYAILLAVSGKSITSWLRTMIEIKIDQQESRTRLLALCTRIDDASAERNNIAHGLWHPGREPQTGIIQTVNIAHNAIFLSEPMTRTDLDDLAERIGEIIAELVHVGVSLGWHKAVLI
jgi:hypothetical protein